MLITEECRNHNVVVDGGELTRNITWKKRPDVSQPCRCPVCHKCYRRQDFLNRHPKGHTTSNRRQYYIDTSKTKSRRTCSRFQVLFQCNSTDGKIHVVSTCVFWRNFTDQNIHIFSTYFFWLIVMVETSTLFARTFFDKIFGGKYSTLFLVKLQENENIRGGFLLLVTLRSFFKIVFLKLFK